MAKQYNVFRKYLYQPIEGAILPLLYKTRLTGNQITSFGLICAIIGSVLIVTMHPILRIVGVLFHQFAILADGLDGAVARYRKQASEFGGWWDNLAARISEFLFLAAASIHAYYLTGRPVYLMLGMVVIFCNTMISSISQLREYVAFVPKKPFTSYGGMLIGRSFFTYALLPLLLLLGRTDILLIIGTPFLFLGLCFQIAKHVRAWQHVHKRRS